MIDMSVEAARAFFAARGDLPVRLDMEATESRCPLDWMLVRQGAMRPMTGFRYYTTDADSFNINWTLLPEALIRFVSLVDGNHMIDRYRWEKITGNDAASLLDRAEEEVQNGRL